jgi:hypothetical protein
MDIVTRDESLQNEMIFFLAKNRECVKDIAREDEGLEGSIDHDEVHHTTSD